MKKGTIGFLVSPLDLTVQRVRVNDYRDIYKWIDAECFDCARINEKGDAFFVDDMGLLVQRANGDFFKPRDYGQPLAGKGLLMGVDRHGESVAPSVSWETFKASDIVMHAFILNGTSWISTPFDYLDDILD